jgi:hypothetical protein
MRVVVGVSERVGVNVWMNGVRLRVAVNEAKGLTVGVSPVNVAVIGGVGVAVSGSPLNITAIQPRQ